MSHTTPIDPQRGQSDPDQLFPPDGYDIGDYQNLRAIGKGGMAQVYLAEDNKMNRQVALKVLSRSLALDSQYRQYFEREIDLLANLRVDSVVRVFARGQEGEWFWYSMELVPGRTLRDALYTESLTLHERLTILAKLANALSQLHDKGIAHRDLKPGNVVLDQEDDRPTLIDFGIAKGYRLPDPNLTRPQQRAGTPVYMSPDPFTEVTRQSTVAMAADVWSFAMMAYEVMADGELPWGLRYLSPDEIFEVITQEEPVPLIEVTPAVSEHLSDVLTACFNLDYEQRPTARDLSQALNQELAGSHDMTEGPTAVALPPPVQLEAETVPSAPIEPEPPPPATPPARSRKGLLMATAALVLVCLAALSIYLLKTSADGSSSRQASFVAPANDLPATEPAEHAPSPATEVPEEDADQTIETEEPAAPQAIESKTEAPADLDEPPATTTVVEETQPVFLPGRPTLLADQAPPILQREWHDLREAIRQTVAHDGQAALLFRVPVDHVLTIRKNGIAVTSKRGLGNPAVGDIKVAPEKGYVLEWYSPTTQKSTTIEWQPEAGTVDTIF